MKAFVAYPGASPAVVDAISGAVEAGPSRRIELVPWQKMRIVGFKVDELIREHIHEADALIADITYANHNVFYEIGYAIAVGKPVIPTVNVAIDHAVERIQQFGLFDMLGWATYSNAAELL